MGTGSDVAIEASDLTVYAATLGWWPTRSGWPPPTLTVIKGNLFWAFAYNLAALPLGRRGLLNPMVAGAAMALSSAFVVPTACACRRFH